MCVCVASCVCTRTPAINISRARLQRRILSTKKPISTGFLIKRRTFGTYLHFPSSADCVDCTCMKAQCPFVHNDRSLDETQLITGIRN